MESHITLPVNISIAANSDALNGVAQRQNSFEIRLATSLMRLLAD